MESSHGCARSRPLTTALERAIPGGARILLDTSTLLYYFGPATGLSEVAADVVDGMVRRGRNQGVISAVSAMEFLVGPVRAGDLEAQRRAFDFLRYFPNLVIRSVDLDVAYEAAVLRARSGLATPDALIVATGLAAATSHFVTNDAAWRTRLGILGDRVSVVYLSSFAHG